VASNGNIADVVYSLTGKGTSLEPIIDKFQAVALRLAKLDNANIINSFYDALRSYDASVTEPALDEMLTEEGLDVNVEGVDQNLLIKAFNAVATEKWVSLVNSYKGSVRPTAFMASLGTLYDEEKADSVYGIMHNPNFIESVNSLDDEVASEVFDTLVYSVEMGTYSSLIVDTAQAASKYSGETAKEVARHIIYIGEDGHIDRAKYIANIFKRDDVVSSINSLGSSAHNVARELIHLNTAFDATKYLLTAAIALGKYEPEVAEYFVNRLNDAAMWASTGYEENFVRAVDGLGMEEFTEAITKHKGRAKLFATKEIFDAFYSESLEAGKNTAQILGQDNIVNLVNLYEGSEESIFETLRRLRISHNIITDFPDLISSITMFHERISSLPREIQQYLISAVASETISYNPDKATQLISLMGLPGVISTMDKYKDKSELAKKVAFELVYTAKRYGTESSVARSALRLQNPMWAEILDTPNLDKFWSN